MSKPPMSPVLVGEDRQFGGGLYIDLIPKTSWFNNVRGAVHSGDWERLRAMVLDRVGRQCELCGAAEDRDNKKYLEAHERFEYDDAKRVQKLVRLVCLCAPCHRATHIGNTAVFGDPEQAMRHMMAVNGWTRERADRELKAQFELWMARSQVSWIVDLSLLDDAGVRLKVSLPEL